MVLGACVGLGLLLAAGRETKPAPKPLDEWRQVQRLEPGSEVEVVLRQGPSLKGLFARVDGDRLRILTFDNAGYSGNVRQTMLSIAASRLEYPVHLEVGGKHFTLDSVLQHVMRDEVHLVRRPLHHSAGKSGASSSGCPSARSSAAGPDGITRAAPLDAPHQGAGRSEISHQVGGRGTPPEQDRKADELAAKRGLETETRSRAAPAARCGGCPQRSCRRPDRTRSPRPSPETARTAARRGCPRAATGSRR
jgi:hypothetical protein